MLVNSKEILEKAKQDNYAVPHFNINNLEWTRYILEEMQELNSGVILGVSEGAIKYMGGVNVVTNLVKSLIKDLNIQIDVVLHLDHGSSFEICQKCIDAGFTSVMIDASHYPLLKNIEITKKVVEYAHDKNVTVEAEIGQIGGTEDGMEGKNYNAKLEDVIALVNSTHIDSVAPALGSVHGLYKGKPNLDFITMKKISENVSIPLVLHGGTGIPDNLIQEAIKNGINKININTELQIAWANEVRKFLKENETVYDPRKVISSDEIVSISNIPNIADVESLEEILSYLGAQVKTTNGTITINPKEINNKEIPESISTKLRASYYFMSALLGKYKKVEMYFPGGCNIGARPIDQTIKGYRLLGAKVVEKSNKYTITASKLTGAKIYLDMPSVGATINIMIVAAKAEGTTIIENAAKEPEIVNVATFLNNMGAKIKGAGTNVIKIEGVKYLHKCFHEVIPDRIEAGTYLIIAALLGENLTINNIIPSHLESLISKLKEAGVNMEIGFDYIKIKEKYTRIFKKIDKPAPDFNKYEEPKMYLL